METSIAKADTQCELEEGAGQAAEVLAHRSAEAGKVGFDEHVDDK
jgi:hypothetical protein